MTIEEALYNVLRSDAAVASLVAGRIYPQEAPQDDAAPLVLYASSGALQHETAYAWANLWECSVRYDCYGGPHQGAYRSAKAVAGAVDAALKALPPLGVIGDVTDPGRVQIKGLSAEGGDDELEPPVHADERGMDYVGASYHVFWSYPAQDRG